MDKCLCLVVNILNYILGSKNKKALMLKLTKINQLTEQGFTHVEVIVLAVVIVIVGAIGSYVIKHNSSHASGFSYGYIGETVQNPGTNTTPIDLSSRIATDESQISALTASASSDSAKVSSDNAVVGQLTNSLAEARAAYDASKAPRNATPVNDAQSALNQANAQLNSDKNTLTTDTNNLAGAKATLTGDEASEGPVSSSYPNSAFYFYACYNPGVAAGTKTLEVAVVAPTYASAMQSGAYAPIPAIQVNGSTVQSFNTNWYYGSNIGISGAPTGPWSVFEVDDINQSGTIAFGPLSTSSAPASWTTPIAINSILTCFVNLPSTGGSATTSSPAITTTTTSTSAIISQDQATVSSDLSAFNDAKAAIADEQSPTAAQDAAITTTDNAYTAAVSKLDADEDKPTTSAQTTTTVHDGSTTAPKVTTITKAQSSSSKSTPSGSATTAQVNPALVTKVDSIEKSEVEFQVQSPAPVTTNTTGQAIQNASKTSVNTPTKVESAAPLSSGQLKEALNQANKLQSSQSVVSTIADFTSNLFSFKHINVAHLKTTTGNDMTFVLVNGKVKTVIISN